MALWAAPSLMPVKCGEFLIALYRALTLRIQSQCGGPFGKSVHGQLSMRAGTPSGQPDAYTFERGARGRSAVGSRMRAARLQFLTFSSDLVFDGRKSDGYVESDRVAPVNAYGENKAEAEKLVQKEMQAALVVRSGPLFGPGDEFNFVVRALRCFAAGRPFSAAHNLIVSPTY